MPADSQTARAWTIRALRPDDLPSVAKILRNAAEAAQWPIESYDKLLSLPGSLALVCEAQNGISGFLIARQVAEEAEVLNLAVLAESRRKGYASALLAAAIERFQNSGVLRIFLEVRESNQAARAFYLKHGFFSSGRRKAYYRDPIEDALCLQKKLGTRRG